MSFNKGEKVRLLSESGDYKIVSRKSTGYYLVKDEHGFDYTVPSTEIVRIHSTEIPISNHISHVIEEKEREEKVNKSKSKSNKKIDTPEIDLHIEELLEYQNNMTNSEILQHQMMCFRGFYKQKRSEGYRKIIAIHGVGEGVLRMEIIHFLHSQDNVEYNDADYRKFGGGATEITFG